MQRDTAPFSRHKSAALRERRADRVLGVSPGLRLMVATGFSICGASAIAAMDSVTDADREEVATGIALVTLFGSVAIAVVPAIGDGLDMGQERLGAVSIGRRRRGAGSGTRPPLIPSSSWASR